MRRASLRFVCACAGGWPTHGTPRACVRNPRMHVDGKCDADADTAAPPPAQQCTTAVIARHIAAYPSGGHQWRSHHPCRRRAVPVQSCIESCNVPVSSLHRVVGEVHDDGASAGRLPNTRSMATSTTVRLLLRLLLQLLGRRRKVTVVADASSMATDGRVKRLESIFLWPSERALVAGRLRGHQRPVESQSESELHQRSECSSANACPAFSNQGSADYLINYGVAGCE
jgi:hypothetical protein